MSLTFVFRLEESQQLPFLLWHVIWAGCCLSWSHQAADWHGRTFYGQCSTCSDMLFHLTRPITMCCVHCCLIKKKTKQNQKTLMVPVLFWNCFVAQWSTTVFKIGNFVSLITSIQIKLNCLWLNFVFIKTNFSPESRRCGENIQTCRAVYSRPGTKRIVGSSSVSTD